MLHQSYPIYSLHTAGTYVCTVDKTTVLYCAYCIGGSSLVSIPPCIPRELGVWRRRGLLLQLLQTVLLCPCRPRGTCWWQPTPGCLGSPSRNRMTDPGPTRESCGRQGRKKLFCCFVFYSSYCTVYHPNSRSWGTCRAA